MRRGNAPAFPFHSQQRQPEAGVNRRRLQKQFYGGGPGRGGPWRRRLYRTLRIILRRCGRRWRRGELCTGRWARP